MKVLVLGSINMDLTMKAKVIPQKGETVIGECFFTSFGGKGANQATSLARLGIRPILIGSVGSDLYGQNSIAELKKNGVDITNIKINKTKNTGIAMILIHDNDNRIILDSGANKTIEIEAVDKAFETEKTGIFLSQLENNIDAIEYGFKKAKENHMYTVLNPAPYVRQSPHFYNLVDLIILNETECELMTKIRVENQNTALKACQYISELGVKDIVITLGEKGVYCYKNQILTSIPSYKVDVVDTTGAGDAFIGGLIYELTNNKNLFEAVKFASKVAAIKITRYGAQSAIPSLEEVKKLEDEGFFKEINE